MERVSFRKVIDTAVVVFAPTGALSGIGPGETGGMLLDTIGEQAMGAWSVRKLRAGHTGSCIQVRRYGPSGPNNSELDFGFAGRNLDTAAVLAFVGTDPLDNGFITTWYDQSGESRDIMMQSDSTKQPKIVNAGALVTPGILFDGTNDCLEATGFTWADFISASKFTMLASFRPTAFVGVSTATGAIIGDSGGGFAGLGVGTVAANSMGVYNWDGAAYDFANQVGLSTSTNYVLIGQHDGGNLYSWRDSATMAGPNPSGETSQLTDVPQLGGQAATFFTGHIIEALVFTVVLDTDARNTLGTNMAEFAGLTW